MFPQEHSLANVTRSVPPGTLWKTLVELKTAACQNFDVSSEYSTFAIVMLAIACVSLSNIVNMLGHYPTSYKFDSYLQSLVAEWEAP